MAMDPMAQDVIRCDLCAGKPVPSPVDVVCNTCNINLCNECLAKHVSSKLSIKHDIVGFRFKTDIPSVICEEHSKLNCDLHCKSCQKSVCPKCISSGSHKHHDVTEISEIFNRQKQIIKKDTEELENLITQVYENEQSELQIRVSKLTEGYDGLKKSILQQGKEWHDEVDIVITKTLMIAEQMQKDDIAMLEKLQSNMNDQLSKVCQTIQENKNFLKSNAGTEIMNYRSRNDELRTVPSSFELTVPTFTPKKIQGEHLSQMFGDLRASTKTKIEGYTIEPSTDKQFIDNPNLIHDIKVKAESEVLRVCCVPNTDQCVVKGDNIKRIDNQSTEHESIKPKSGNDCYIDLTITRQGNLVYSDCDDRSINMVQHGKIDTIIRLKGWKPWAICSTSSDDLLVSMMTDDGKQSKVVRYAGTKVTQEIQFDDKTKPLYTYPHYISENKNLQVCVSDWNTSTVVVTDKEGKLMFRYDGNLSSKKYEDFYPHGLATDCMCHILVADSNNHCVHIITHEGRFLRYIDNIALNEPTDLSISSDDLLYIAEFGRPYVKVVKYFKS